MTSIECITGFTCVQGECLEAQDITLSISASSIPEDGSVAATVEVSLPSPAGQDIDVILSVSGSAGAEDFTLSTSLLIYRSVSPPDISF